MQTEISKDYFNARLLEISAGLVNISTYFRKYTLTLNWDLASCTALRALLQASLYSTEFTRIPGSKVDFNYLLQKYSLDRELVSKDGGQLFFEDKAYLMFKTMLYNLDNFLLDLSGCDIIVNETDYMKTLTICAQLSWNELLGKIENAHGHFAPGSEIIDVEIFENKIYVYFRMGDCGEDELFLKARTICTKSQFTSILLTNLYGG